MDHHCPWVGNCIGYYNYKFFMNMLYTVMLLTIIIVVSTRRLVHFTLLSTTVEPEVVYFVVFCYFTTFALMLLITLFFSFHVYLMVNNYTTIEFCEKRQESEQFKDSPYNRGWYLNFKAVLGNNPIFWPFPIAPDYEGEGLYFKLREDIDFN
jgi:hypothetical protein